MKKIQLASFLILIGLMAALNFGCKKKEAPSTGQNPTPGEQKSATSEPQSANGGQTNPAIVSAEKTSFNEVTSQLDPGGNFYLYLGTAQWLDGLSAKISRWQQIFESMPQLKDEDRTNMDKAFGVITDLINDSGIEDISGVGMSSIEIEKGLYRNKALLHHYPGKGPGFLWKFMGKKPHALTGLDLLPANTVLAIFSDMDLPLLWSVAQQEVAKADFPQAQEMLQKLPEQFEQKTQVKWNKFLDSLGGEFGFALTLDESNNVPIPMAGGMIEIPEPGLLIVVKVNDETIFNRIDQGLKKNPMVISVDKNELKMRTMPLPIPFLTNVRPTAASGGGYLFIASSDALIEEALAVKSGQKPGLKSTDEFKRLSQNIPDRGNQFTFMSERFGKILFEIQKQAMAKTSKNSPQQAQWMQSLFRQNRLAFAYSVGINAPDGCLTIGNGNQSYASVALLAPAFTVGMLSAIAIPNFVKARATAQQNACINNLRQIDAAKQQWALENNKKSTDTPTWDDLKPYLRGPVPLICPAGGTYAINAVSEPPTCSIPGHKLP